MTDIQCSSCFKQLCVGGGYQEKDFCPKHVHPEIYGEAEKIYFEDAETREIARNAAIVESRGYMAWPRLKDIIELTKGLKFTRIAVVFCPDLWREAKKTCRILTENDLTVTSRVCGMKKSTPRMPADFMDEIIETNPDIIINAGLCVAFESQTLKRLRNIPTTTFIARDSALNNYPAAEVYTSDKWKDWAEDVYRNKLGLK